MATACTKGGSARIADDPTNPTLPADSTNTTNPADTTNTNNPADSTTTTNPADSATMLLGKWKLVRDSSTNIGNYFFFEGGYMLFPNPGVYTGREEDYYHFGSDGNFTGHANGMTFHSTYELTPGELIITTMLVHGKGKVITLTAREATFDWSNTSPNGGKFFRRTYLKK